jgi:uncharacterized protein YdeI (YjbR/CyaY-like superfamily)
MRTTLFETPNSMFTLICRSSRMDMKNPENPLHFQNKNEWRVWLQENHATQKEAWLVILKNHASRPGVFYEEAVEEAVCFGWIDGVMKSAPAEYYFLRFTPRKRGSIWSVSNQQRVERLTAQGKMTAAGMAEVREAKENGEWEAAIRREDISSLPEDLSRAMEGNTEAQANFEKYPASQKKQFLYWIASARTEKTRQKRIQGTVEMAAKNQRLGEM